MKRTLMTPRIASSPGARQLMHCFRHSTTGGLASGSSGDPGGGLMTPKSGTTYICSGTIDIGTGLGSA